jgi:mono/diheme cytochrome c family protein
MKRLESISKSSIGSLANQPQRVSVRSFFSTVGQPEANALRLMVLKCLLPLFLLFWLPSVLLAEQPEANLIGFRAQVAPLLKKYCVECHGKKKPEGKLSLELLDPDLLRGANADHWHEVLNQINEGEMPPEDEPQLSKKELTTITGWLERELSKATAQRISTGGRSLMRRMSRYEYHYTLQDLLGISLDYRASLPGDLSGEDGLKTNAVFLGMSMVQMQSYLDVAEQALAEAIPNGTAKIYQKKITKFAVDRVKGTRSKGKSTKVTNPAIIAPAPHFKESWIADDLPRKVTFDERPFAGRFRLKVTVIATASSDGRLPELTLRIGHRSSGDYIPKKVMGSKTVPAGASPQIIEFVGNIEDFPLGNKGAYYGGSGSHNVTHMSVWLSNSVRPKVMPEPGTKLDALDEPLLELKSIELEGPLLGGYPSQTAKDLLPTSVDRENESAQAAKVLKAFMRRAYRRPVTAAEVTAAVQSFVQFRKIVPDFKSAIRKSMAMVLISPKFIYLVEPAHAKDKARALSAHELATRLSYFLWASMPDRRLFSLADSGQLLKPVVLRAEVERMRQDKKFQRFATHFADQWLGVSAMDNVAVNPTVYPQFSDEIKDNLRLETLSFASYVLSNDRNCQEFFRSDYAMLNQVVAKHYGIDGVYGSHFRPVRLDPDDHRGGVLTQGSILIAGSDGSQSNPIYRGVWLQKRLFANPPPPPPPGVPALDESKSDTSKLTLKEQIALHRKDAACARCHQKIDPWGVPLENYDATGRWRTAFEGPARKKSKKKPRLPKTPVDAESTLPDGQVVRGPAELQAYLLKHKSQNLSDALTRRMLGYALGRHLEFSDKATVNKLSKAFRRGGYRASILLEGIVTSDAFLNK